MERCPTCKAPYTGGQVCHRCQTDLRQVLAIEQAAWYHQQQVRLALQGGKAQAAGEHALRACEFYRSPASVEVLALAALAGRDFSTALALWRELKKLS